MITMAPRLTEMGKSLIVRGVSGEKLTFTCFKLGAGYNGDAAENIRNMVEPIMTVGISVNAGLEDGLIRLQGQFENSLIPQDFVWRELGIYCKGEDNAEVLYAYCADEAGENLAKVTTGVAVRQSLNAIVAVGEAENVTAIITSETMYATKEAFDAHEANRSNPHGVTKAQVGLGNVPNLAPANMVPGYETLSTLSVPESTDTFERIVGKLRLAISTLTGHVGNTSNPHSVTKAQVGLGNVDNLSAANLVPGQSSTVGIQTLNASDRLYVLMGKIKAALEVLKKHYYNTENPHIVTAKQVGVTYMVSASDVQVAAGESNPKVVSFTFDESYDTPPFVMAALRPGDISVGTLSGNVSAIPTEITTTGCKVSVCYGGASGFQRVRVCIIVIGETGLPTPDIGGSM